MFLIQTAICLLLFQNPAHSIPREFEPREPRMPQCNQGKAFACRDAHRAAEDQARLQASSMNPEIQSTQARLEKISALQTELRIKNSQLLSEKNLLSAELAFCGNSENQRRSKILGEFPDLEDFFFIHPLQKKWAERYPSERAVKLSTRLNEVKTEELESITKLDRISSNFHDLSAHLEALNSRKSKFLEEAAQHESMWKGGCIDEFCPSPQP